jgi:hypothetical protein
MSRDYSEIQKGKINYKTNNTGHDYHLLKGYRIRIRNRKGYAKGFALSKWA